MGRFKIKEIPISSIVYVEKNANFMEQTTFQQLVKNIKKDGELSTVPFTIYHEDGKYKGKYEVISGNHRVKAAEMAGLVTINVMWVDSKEITNDEKRAIQLSHNSIHGQDDLELLREIVSEIEDGEYREYAHIDETRFEELDKMEYSVIQPTNEVVDMSFTFYDVAKVAFDDLCTEIESRDAYEELVLLPKDTLDRFNETAAKIQKKYQIKSLGLTVMKMIELAKLQIDGND